MAILYIENKHWLTPLRAFLIFFAAAGVSAYVMWPEAPKHESAKVSLASPTTPHIFAYPNAVEVGTDVIRAKSVSTDQFDDEDDPVETASDDQIGDLPKFGAAAVGQEGAWDGRDEEGRDTRAVSEPYAAVKEEEVKTDYLGNPCEDPVGIPTARLRAMLPPEHIKDYCGYDSWFSSRWDRTPAEILVNIPASVIDPIALARMVNSGVWQVTDYEKVPLKSLTSSAVLGMYLILKQGGSPYAQDLIYYKSGDDQPMESYLMTGACPTDRFELVGPLCLPPLTPQEGY